MTLQQEYELYLSKNPVDKISKTSFFTKMKQWMTFEEIVEYKRPWFECLILWKEYIKSVPSSTRVNKRFFQKKYRKWLDFDSLMALRVTRRKYKTRLDKKETIFERINRKRRMQWMINQNWKWEYKQK